MNEKGLTSSEREELDYLTNANIGAQVLRAALQTLGGTIPVGGGLLSAAAGMWSEREQGRVNHLLQVWIKQLEEDLRAMGETMAEVLIKLDLSDEAVRNRLESPEYQALVSRVFRSWNTAESDMKRGMLRKLLTNAAGTNITGDDIISLFISWINDYNDIHFKVVSAVYKQPGITRLGMWEEIGGEAARDDSADADLFKYVINQLTLGYVMRQERISDEQGRFRRQSRRPQATPARYMKSPFDNEVPYVLTELGKQFVHYALDDPVTKIEAPRADR
jgi:hypothetical protein